MATPSCESEGLSLHRYGLAFLSNRVLPPWNWVVILAAVTMGGTAAISCVSGPMIPTTLLFASRDRAATAPSASSHWVSACWSTSCWPNIPPPSLIAFWAICEPWSIAAPRLERLPVKQDSTPMVTGPVGRWELELGVLPHAARTHAAAATLATRRAAPDCRLVFSLTRFIVCVPPTVPKQPRSGRD